MVSLGGDASGANSLTGQVTDVSFLGSIVRIRVRLGDTGPVVVLDEFNEPTLTLPELRETVNLTFPQDGPLVLEVEAPIESLEALIAEK
jgi:putative spermidine/putrescine transport system ATP-binding protein